MNPRHIHFIGICGVAMSALAIAFKKAGFTVTGSDVGFYPPVSTNLKDAGVEFYPGWHPDRVLRSFLAHRSLNEGGSEGGKNDPKDLIVVVGNVASSTNPEWLFAKENNLACKSYPEMIRDYFIKDTSIVCAGTYGKSTSTTLLAWILKENNLNPSYMFGGVMCQPTPTPPERGTIAIPPAAITNSNISVVEGDEYTASRWDSGPKFSYYKPTHLLLTSVVWDHADVYPTEKSYIEAFQKLVDSIPSTGTMVISEKALPTVILTPSLSRGKNPLNSTGRDPSATPQDDKAKRTIVGYGKNPGNDYIYQNIKQSKNGVTFEIKHQENTWQLSTSCLGEYMADNITGCFAIAHKLGITPDKIITAIKSFAGVRRRLEKRYENSITVFDDIAHSPKKAEAVLASLRAVYNGKIIAVFEPNSGNRESASAPGYKNAFASADLVIIPHLTKLKVGTGKPKPMEGNELARVIAESHKNVVHIDDDTRLVKVLKEKTQPGDVVVFLGSHGFRGMIEALIEMFNVQ